MDLTDSPEEIIPGAKAWKNPGNRFTCVLLHFTADPDGADEDARREGMPEDKFKREHGLDFSSFAGKPVYADYDDHKHLSSDIHYHPAHPLLRSFDFGYHRPAVTYAQVHDGLWVLGEVMGEDMTLERFMEDVVIPYEHNVFGDKAKYINFADPAGRQVSDKSEHTSFSILSNYGIHPLAKKSEIGEGLTLIRMALSTKTGDKYQFQIHPRCNILREGLKGGYRYPEATLANPNPLYPLKDGFYDHLQDTLRYMVVNNFRLYKPRPEPVKELYPPLYESVLKRQKRDYSGYGEWE